MTSQRVPTIFSPSRALARRTRMLRRTGEDRARFLADEQIEDTIERLAFLRLEPARAFIIGDPSSRLAGHLAGNGSEVVEADLDTHNLEAPYPNSGFDLVAIFGLLDAINDLPGALIHARNALTPGGLAITSFVGGASLPQLRAAMLAADGDRPAARIHPMVDHRAAPQLLQRALWRDPVVDTHTLRVRYSSLDQLVSDLRDQGLTSALADHAPNLGKAALGRARAAFLNQADSDGKVTEVFELITLTGRK